MELFVKNSSSELRKRRYQIFYIIFRNNPWELKNQEKKNKIKDLRIRREFNKFREIIFKWFRKLNMNNINVDIDSRIYYLLGKYFIYVKSDNN